MPAGRGGVAWKMRRACRATFLRHGDLEASLKRGKAIEVLGFVTKQPVTLLLPGSAFRHPLRAYVINLDSSPERLASVLGEFAATTLHVERIPAVDGAAISFPIPEYQEDRYQWLHGRPTSPGHVGCYLSHVEAMKRFLATTDEHALVVEDDVTLSPDFEAVVAAAIEQSSRWNLLRLTGLGQGAAVSVAPLVGGYSLCINFTRLKGTGAYLIDRAAAQALCSGLLPMWLPIDHAIDREWVHGLTAACVQPFPASQVESGFRSSIHRGVTRKLPEWCRVFGAYPFQTWNEVSRFVFRTLRYLTVKFSPTSA